MTETADTTHVDRAREAAAAVGDAHGHDPHLAHHFATPRQQFESGKLGMWIFLATEVLMFGGLFCAYAVYRSNHPEIFQYAHQFLDTTLGAVNTVILICSSLTMAWAVRAVQLNQHRTVVWCLVLTLLGAFGFLGIKYVEYKHKWEDGLLWARQYRPEHVHDAKPGDASSEASPAQADAATPAPQAEAAPAPADPDAPRIKPAPVGPRGLSAAMLGEPTHMGGDHGPEPKNVGIFFSVYFLMTGLHGIHVLVGMGLIGWILRRAVNREFSSRYFAPVDLVGLYWHLVDLIWIFLFPLLYLID
ncbi:MAG TPA: cytochrome c oxidase subunit 3 family protein [Phycisphaerae bacterium]|nr:cytochrome c oxidase subunit 3 family protein [Phycisphaerae bacterium]